MRVLYSFPHPIGAPGIGTTAIQQVIGLLRRGHDVTVMATSIHPSAPPLPKSQSTMIVAGLRVPHRVLGVDNAKVYHDARVAEYLKGHHGDFDIVHCWPGATLKTARAAAALGVPCLREVPNTHTEHAYSVVEQLCDDLGVVLPVGSSHRRNPRRLAQDRAEYDAAFRLLLPSDSVLETFRERGFCEEKLLRHQYGFDPNVFQPGPEPSDGPLRALFLGSVGPRKGLHIALQAWTQSKASKTGRFTIYGRVEGLYQSVIAPYLGAPGVEMYAFTADANGALRSSDVLLLPSFEEGSALVTYEAQGCGVIPLVSSVAGAICAHEVTGLIHTPGDVETLRNHLDDLSDRPRRRAQMRQAILNQRSSLTWAAAAERLEICYESARAAFKMGRGKPLPDPGRFSASPASVSNGAQRDLVFTFWQETWADAVYRQYMTPDRLAYAILAHPKVRGLLIANPYRAGWSQFFRRLQGRRMPPLPNRDYPTAMVSPRRMRRKDGIGQSSLRQTYQVYDKRMALEAQRLGLEKPAVITTNPFYAAYGSFDWAGPITYFAFDDWAGYDDHKLWWPDYHRAYAEIQRRGHGVCAVSEHLLTRIGPTGPGLVVPNGIVPEEWQAPWRPPEWLADLPRPYILYAGAIHRRLDLGAVRDIAERYPEGSIIFVGPVAHADVADELQRIPGVTMRAWVDRPELAGLTRAADVCIMPHHINTLTQSMSPLKLYEYCAAGGPAVATDLAPVRNLHEQIVLVPPGESFADGVERALALGPMSEEARERFVRENSWRDRHDAILNFALR